MDETGAAEVAENAEIPNETLNGIITVVAAATQAVDDQLAGENVSENGSESSVSSLESEQTILRNFYAFTDSDLVLVSEETLVQNSAKRGEHDPLFCALYNKQKNEPDGS